MPRLASGAVLAIGGVLVACSLAPGQDPSRFTSLIQEDGIKPGSPLETLEQVTGQKTGESNSEREKESEGNEIETDRDSFTPATTVVGRGRVVLETAYSFIDNRGFKDTHSFPETLLRFGMSDYVELRLGWNAEIGGSSSELSSAGGEGDPFEGTGKVKRDYTMSYGAKFRLTDQDRWLPRSVLMVQGFTPTGGSTGSATATSFIADYAAGWVLPNRWLLDGSLRYGLDSEGGNRFSEWAPSVVLRVPFGEKLGVHLEYFGIITAGKKEDSSAHYLSPGVRYLITPDLEIGLRLGWGLTNQSAVFFTNAGFGWRF